MSKFLLFLIFMASTSIVNSFANIASYPSNLTDSILTDSPMTVSPTAPVGNNSTGENAENSVAYIQSDYYLAITKSPYNQKSNALMASVICASGTRAPYVVDSSMITIPFNTGLKTAVAFAGDGNNTTTKKYIVALQDTNNNTIVAIPVQVAQILDNNGNAITTAVSFLTPKDSSGKTMKFVPVSSYEGNTSNNINDFGISAAPMGPGGSVLLDYNTYTYNAYNQQFIKVSLSDGNQITNSAPTYAYDNQTLKNIQLSNEVQPTFSISKNNGTNPNYYTLLDTLVKSSTHTVMFHVIDASDPSTAQGSKLEVTLHYTDKIYSDFNSPLSGEWPDISCNPIDAIQEMCIFSNETVPGVNLNIGYIQYAYFDPADHDYAHGSDYTLYDPVPGASPNFDQPAIAIKTEGHDLRGALLFVHHTEDNRFYEEGATLYPTPNTLTAKKK